MEKQEILQFFRDFKANQDERTKNNKAYTTGEISPELLIPCNNLILKEVYIQPSMLNELYIIFVEFEQIKIAMNKDEDELFAAYNEKYLKYSQNHEGLIGEFFKAMMMMRINQILEEA